MEPSQNTQKYIILGSIAAAIIGSLVLSLSGMKQVSVNQGSAPGQSSTHTSVVALHDIKKGASVNWADIGVLNTTQVIKLYPDFSKEAGKLTFNQKAKRVGVAKKQLKTGEPLYSKTVNFEKDAVTRKK